MTVFNVPQASVAIADSNDRFPVRRIFCIGRNYAAHAKEMGGDPDQEPPFYFNKAADTVVDSGSVVDYPPRTDDLQHEIELVVAIKKDGRNISVGHAGKHVFGYAVGIDLTRRDLQAQAKASGWPWDVAKNFDQSAPVGEIHTAASIGHPASGRIWLAVNGDGRQDGNLNEMIWTVPQLLAEISTYCALAAGDLVFTGTPAGVGKLAPGDLVTGGVEGVGEVGIEIR